ncbi:MAG: hypothetical protein ABIP06_14060 [Pyrinomonadaceae bacterium]
MKENWEELLLNPPPDSKLAQAKEFGIDLTLLFRNLRLTPQERIDELQQIISDFARLELQIKPQLKQIYGKKV